MKISKNLKRLGIYIVAGISLVLNLILGGKAIFNKNTSNNVPIQAVRIIDGDTFELADGNRVRLAGIDAPEYPKGCLANEAKNRLTELLLGKNLKLEETGTDNFGRKLGFVFLDKVLINQVLVEEGLASVLEDESQYLVDLRKKEVQAQTLKKGIWSDRCQPDENCVIKANYRRDKDTKIYHLPECFNYERIVVNEKEGDRWFCTEKEAQAAGFRKSEDCPE